MSNEKNTSQLLQILTDMINELNSEHQGEWLISVDQRTDGSASYGWK